MQRLNLEKWQAVAGETRDELARLLRGGGGEVAGIIERVDRRLNEHKSRSAISLAFIGQYSAGKSTIISALTGRDDIEIGADITTSRCTPYDWMDLRIVDTPGLWTEYPEHDALTNAEIERSDLLAFCVTVELFEPVVLRNFRELAADNGYAPKMLLVVNKLYSEAAGDVEDRLRRYCANIEQMIGVKLFHSIPVVFCDAEMYRDARERNHEKFLAKSRFDDLIAALNKLSDERGLIGKADTPFRIVLGGVNDALVALSSGDERDKAYLHLLNRFLELLQMSRRMLLREFREAAAKASRAVLEEGLLLVSAVDGSSAEQVAQAQERCQQRLRERLEEINTALKGTILSIGNHLQQEVDEIRSLPLFEAYAAALKTAGVALDPVPLDPKQTTRVQRQVAALQNLAAGLSGVFSRTAKKAQALPTAVPAARHTDALTMYGMSGMAIGGSMPELHDAAQTALPQASSYFDDAIRSTVDHLNTKFHWNLSANPAIDATHRMNDILHTLGPLISIGSAALALWGLHQEQKKAEAIAKARMELQDKFAEAREEIRRGFEAQGEAIDRDVLRPLENDVRAKRKAAEGEIGAGGKAVEELHALRERIETHLQELAATAR